jgi:hypothetical protein
VNHCSFFLTKNLIVWEVEYSVCVWKHVAYLELLPSDAHTHISHEGIIILGTSCRNEVHEVKQNSYVKIAGVCSINESSAIQSSMSNMIMLYHTECCKVGTDIQKQKNVNCWHSLQWMFPVCSHRYVSGHNWTVHEWRQTLDCEAEHWLNCSLSWDLWFYPLNQIYVTFQGFGNFVPTAKLIKL